MKRTRQERLRLGLLFVLVCLFFAVALVRLVHLQVFLQPKFSKIVNIQSTATITIPADRGAVYDRLGQLVAKNVICYSLYAYPKDGNELRSVTAYLDRMFGLQQGEAKKKYRLEPHKFSWIKRHLPDSLAAVLETHAPRGLYLREESERVYPFGLVGKQILGFTDIDNKGLSGFELSYDSLLAGKAGTADVRRDGLQNTYRVKEAALAKPVPGTSLVMTVDWRLQDIVERELIRAVEEYHAKSAMAVFLNCRTGHILAMAHCDPEETSRSRPTKLCSVSDQFEPGSVFKAFTAAGLLDAGVINFNDSIYCDSGKWRVGRRILHDDKEHEWLTFREIMELSSNIGIAKYALLLPGEELFDVYRRFGFGQKLRCGLPGETAGRLVPPSRWSEYNIAALSMGHSVATSPLQLAAAFAAIANGGELLRPQLLLGLVDEDGYVVAAAERELIGRAMKPESVDSLHAFLRGVVEHGTAEPVNSPVVAIAGKTGTAEIPDLVNGGYHKNRFNASFAGFFPYESPVVAGIVVLKDPRPITYGGHTAGPTFRRIAEEYTVLNPDAFMTSDRLLAAGDGRMENTVEAPDFVGRDLLSAQAEAVESGVRLRVCGEEGNVFWQFPPADRILFEGDEVLIAVGDQLSGLKNMVDLTGLPLRTVAAFLHQVGIKYKVEGRGRVVKQSIRPGMEINEQTKDCRLTCRPT